MRSLIIKRREATGRLRWRKRLGDAAALPPELLLVCRFGLLSRRLPHYAWDFRLAVAGLGRYGGGTF